MPRQPSVLSLYTTGSVALGGGGGGCGGEGGGGGGGQIFLRGPRYIYIYINTCCSTRDCSPRYMCFFAFLLLVIFVGIIIVDALLLLLLILSLSLLMLLFSLLTQASLLSLCP